ncbi:hypothetical protein Q361_10949 [Flavobacterium croceum DSM 17960]|uniref:Uncharacterized protein n=1 Tax=Flavobacterium croceum DSM 17960 TaxID=1121886 RepID=A0A2S4N797_9FLAO|nr:hypothetical protein [Flavobacterium croceum]POS01589.1 hypothetical protein Q361_10949 [Flavobacterium croceum DSM 17960]
MLQNIFDIPLNKASIDSMTVFVELDKIIVKDYKLVTPYKVFYDDTAEIIDELHNPRPVYLETDGIKFRFSKVVWTHPKTKETKEMICITVSTKMLKYKYFQGLNKDNVTDVVNFINSHGIIEITVDTFLQSTVNDIDLCVNYHLEFNAYKSALVMLHHMVKQSKKHLVEIFPKRENMRVDDNFGLTFSKRETASIGNPFVKFYNKAFELINNSTEFYNAFIFPQIKQGLKIDNIIRKEMTIKNAKHKDNVLKKHVTSVEKLQTVNDLFTLSQIELDTICNVQLKYYYEKREFSVSSDLSPMDKLISYYMFELVQKGCDKVALLYPLKLIDCKRTRSRTKKKIEQLMDITFTENYMENKLKENSLSNQFIKMLEIW